MQTGSYTSRDTIRERLSVDEASGLSPERICLTIIVTLEVTSFESYRGSRLGGRYSGVQ